jgi:hypothetical protein
LTRYLEVPRPEVAAALSIAKMLCHPIRFKITTQTVMRHWWSASLVHARHTHDKDLFVEEVLVFLDRLDLSPVA